MVTQVGFEKVSEGDVSYFTVCLVREKKPHPVLPSLRSWVEYEAPLEIGEWELDWDLGIESEVRRYLDEGETLERVEEKGATTFVVQTSERRLLLDIR